MVQFFSLVHMFSNQLIYLNQFNVFILFISTYQLSEKGPLTFGSAFLLHLHLIKETVIVNLPIFLDITSYWSKTDMKTINWC